jgi:protein-glutamine gamma-glutamyltransferase
VLQVAVTSVLAPGVWFGIGLMVYVCGALWTMSVASLYQVQQQYDAGDAGWKLALQNAVSLTPATGRVLLVRPSVQHDESHRWITRQFFGGLTVLVAMSLSVSAAFFVFTPRIWFGPQNIFSDERMSGRDPSQSVTGFARHVKLGEIGQVLESLKTVFTVQFYDASSDELLTIDEVTRRMGMDEPLFRGVVLTQYERGRWTPENIDQPVKIRYSFNQPGIRQEYTLEPSTNDILFCVGIPEAAEIPPRRESVFRQQATGVLARETRPDGTQRLSYTAYTAAVPPELARLQALPVSRGLWFQGIESHYFRRNQMLPRGLNRLQQLARDLVAEAETKAGRKLTPSEAARHLEQYLRDSGEFGYTLNLSITDPDIDPVEDFLFNRKEGHCEYFGSALALMLRSVGVPARMVSGFKGAERNDLRRAWEVQERFAHVWVEAWTESNHWVTLDPTPALERAEGLQAASNKVGLWGRVNSTTLSLWTDYVINVNLQQQRDQIYVPLRDFALKVWSLLQRWVEWGPALWKYLNDLFTHPEQWLSVRGGITAFVLLFAIALLVRGAVWLFRWYREGGWNGGRNRRRQQQLVVAFYDRFLKAVKRLGLERQPAETPQEFAAVAQQRLRPRLEPAGLAQLPDAVCTAYYRIRFGGETVPPAELTGLEAQLATFEQVLAQQA